jgi:hypothetical protein
MFPTTHLMFFNTPLLKSLMNSYGLSALRSYRIPGRIVSQINALDLGYDNCPKAGSIYDTLHLVIAMAHHEGYGFQKIDLANQEAVHIGRPPMASSASPISGCMPACSSCRATATSKTATGEN